MVDRISWLSDELLCHILSFLPTEQAVATSVLSKRWRHLWTSVPVLDYDDQIYLRNDRPSFCFERFVSTTLLARDVRQPITRFRLKYGACASEIDDAADVNYARSIADINVWVNTAIQRGILNLDIDISPTNYYYSLNCCILSCRTLVVLKLKGLSLNVSSSVELPSLKSLHLEAVRFVEPKYLMELLFGCPMLEDLKISTVDYADDEYDDSVVSKEGFKNLHLPKLVRADLSFVGMDDTDILLKAICNVEFLRIEQYGAVFVVPEFPHVRHLGLFMVSHNWHSVLLVLKNCPKLQSFKLNLNRSFLAEDVLPYSPFVVPECLTSGLTKCYLKRYGGTESDLLFAKYIMQNSTSLRSMKIQSDLSNQLELLKELALCRRKSELCELSFN